MTEKTFIDSTGDTLKVHNFGGDRGNGALTIRENGRGSVFELDNTNRRQIAVEILAGTDNYLVEGPLPEAKLEQSWNGVDRVVCDGMSGEISQAEIDYFLNTAKQRLAIANKITAALADKEVKEELARQARLAEKLKERRDKLAREVSGLNWITYGGVNGATAKAINRIIELEDAAK